MQPTDVIKLLYQRTFGGEHMAPDVLRVESYLKEEYATVTPSKKPPFIEPIGGGIVRLYLSCVPKTSIGTVARLFVQGASLHRGGIAVKTVFCLVSRLLQ